MNSKRTRIDSTTITEPELQVLRAFRVHQTRHNVPPTFEEAAKASQRSKSTVRHIIARLLRKGLLSKADTETRYRNIVLTKLGLAASRKRISKK
jgi:DNA-binding MarR family transcriptional regulator